MAIADSTAVEQLQAAIALAEKVDKIQARIEETERRRAEATRQFDDQLIMLRGEKRKAQQSLIEAMPTVHAPAAAVPLQRARKGSKKEAVVAMVKQSPTGLTSGEIRDGLNARGLPSSATQVSSLLSGTKNSKGDRLFVLKDGRFTMSE